MQGTVWSHLYGDVPPEDALKKPFLGNNSVAPEAGALRPGHYYPQPQQPPGCHEDGAAPHTGV